MRGHIKQRSNGSYSIVLDLGKDTDTGKRKQKWITVRGNKKEAEKELAKHLNDYNTGSFVEPSKLTVGEFLKRWLVDYAETKVSPKTLERYRGIVDQHLIPELGHLPLARLQPLHIQGHYTKLMKGGRKDGREGGLSPQTILHHHRLLHKALEMAVKWLIVARNVADAVEPPTVTEREVEAIDEVQSAWLMDAAIGTRLYTPIFLAIAAGLRRGEILGLRWSDLDTDLGVLKIQRSVEETKSGTRIKEPKTKRGRRTIALPQVALEALEIHRAAQDERKAILKSDYEDSDLICCSDMGKLWTPSAFTSAYRDLLKRRKLTGPNFHALRHSHASHLLKAGVDIKMLSQRLGHSRTAFTLDKYVHILPGQDDEAAKRVNVALKLAIDGTHKRVM